MSRLAAARKRVEDEIARVVNVRNRLVAEHGVDPVQADDVMHKRIDIILEREKTRPRHIGEVLEEMFANARGGR